LSGTRPSLGVYGPDEHDRSGVARYIASSIDGLRDGYRVTLVSNASQWVDPNSFDAVLYHLGNNRMHHSAFRAARRRAGVALIHEYMHLDYYYQACDRIDPDLKAEIVSDLVTATGVPAVSLTEFVARCRRSGVTDPYTVDIQIEKHVVGRSGVTAVHSEAVAGMLRTRYPSAAVEVVPFPVEPWRELSDTGAMKLHGVPDGAFTFGSFGFIGDYKKIDWIVAAWRRWRDRPPDTRLLLVGERQIEVDTEAEGIIETGYVDDTEFKKLLVSVDCGIQLREPSLGETSAPAAYLAAHRRPAIFSDIPEMRLLGQTPRTTYVKSDGEVVDSLTAAMREQYALGREPRRGFDPRFSWDRWTQIMLKLLASSR
jgi:glycosyltransferase involved in cell wall biosynthesis